MYFEVKKKYLFRFRNKGYKCVVKDVFGRTVRSKSKSTYRDAWEWGYSYVKERRRLQEILSISRIAKRYTSTISRTTLTKNSHD